MLGFREATVVDATMLESWLRDQIKTIGVIPDQLVAVVEERCRELLIEAPAPDRIDRIVRTAIRVHEEQFQASVANRLAPETRERLEALLHPAEKSPPARRPTRPRNQRRRCCSTCVAILAGRVWRVFRRRCPDCSWFARSHCPQTCSTMCCPTNLNDIGDASRRKPPTNCAAIRRRPGSPGSRFYVSMLALHLLQNCMVYINTLMLQRVLARPQWSGRLTARDIRALTPLIWEHVNPYGRFELDMEARLPID